MVNSVPEYCETIKSTEQVIYHRQSVSLSVCLFFFLFFFFFITKPQFFYSTRPVCCQKPIELKIVSQILRLKLSIVEASIFLYPYSRIVHLNLIDTSSIFIYVTHCLLVIIFFFDKFISNIYSSMWSINLQIKIIIDFEHLLFLSQMMIYNSEIKLVN